MSRDALVVGINQYRSLVGLSTPANDANAIADCLRNKLGFRVVRHRPEEILNQQPVVSASKNYDLPALQKDLVELFTPSSILLPQIALFYFSGHGVRSSIGESSGFCATSNVDLPEGFNGLPFSWLRQLVLNSPIPQKVVWLDCCYAGGILNLEEANPVIGGKGSLFFLASSRDFESSYFDQGSQYSQFTKVLLEAIDPNKQPDGVVNANLISAYISRCFESQDQRPVAAIQGEIEFVNHPGARPAPPTNKNFVESIRIQIRTSEIIQHFCGNVRVWKMPSPISLQDIYTKVVFRENITSRHRSSFLDLDPISDSARAFPAIEVVDQHHKLIILGRPGSGKTTFLKYLAIKSIEEQDATTNCPEERNLRQFIPFFVSLKDLAEPSPVSISSYIERCYQIDISTLEELFNEGKGLVLLDGLDEIREAERSSVMKQINNFINQFHRNRFIITCRTAATPLNFSAGFQNFEEVEIANFKEEQISAFVKKWFDANRTRTLMKSEQFLFRLSREGNKSIRDMAVNPLLLVLLCITFVNDGGFPATRSDLYRDAMYFLLTQWDESRNIERTSEGSETGHDNQHRYEDMPILRKIHLLSEIAYTNFKDNRNFFDRSSLENTINNYVENLSEIDNKKVLESIEAQDGLLIKVSENSPRNTYSFSHVAFYEYFTARYICDNQKNLQDLAQHVFDSRWQEVILLVVEMLPNCTNFMQSLKNQIDKLLAEDKKIQEFLEWVDNKSQSLSRSDVINANLSAIRACYLDFDIALDFDRKLAWHLDPNFTRYFTCASFVARAKQSDVLRAFSLLDEISDDLGMSEDLEHAMTITFARVEVIKNLLKNCDKTSNFGKKLGELAIELEDIPDANDRIAVKKWLQDKGSIWGDKLRDIIVPYHSLGEEWQYSGIIRDPLKYQFSEEQQELLDKYYHANLLLIRCLRNNIYITRNVRATIKETLLLPVSRISSSL